MIEQCQRDRRFSVIDLSRNFGHQGGFDAGLAAAEGFDAVVMMDGDLQDPPELIGGLVAEWRSGAEIVQAVRQGRDERGIRRLVTGFLSLARLRERFPLPAHTGIFGLLNAQALRELNRLPEKNRFLPGLRAWIGFDQRTISYLRPDRVIGKPKQSLMRLVRYAIDGFISFSYKPLRMMIAAGCAIAGCGFLLAIGFILRAAVWVMKSPRLASPLWLPWSCSGRCSIDRHRTVGEYLGRVYDEAKQRPLYIVRRCHGALLDQPPSNTTKLNGDVSSSNHLHAG